jgi:crotonobetainyl-CoA:carnitine CoA-transferase CaiB-like acyl-CoA transferase
VSAALENVTVVELTTETFSATTAAMLGDFGANVIRIDQATRGEESTCDPHDRGQDGDLAWDGPGAVAHRNKRSVTVDLDSPGGMSLLEQMVAQADVLITDWPIETLRSHRLDPDHLTAQLPRLVYAIGSGFGMKGPDAQLPAIDELAAARTGMMPILGQPDQPPIYPDLGGMYTAGLLAFGVMLALHERRHNDLGQIVDTSLLAGNMFAASLDVQAYLTMRSDRFLHPTDKLDSSNPMSGLLYRTGDDRWVGLSMPDTDRYWPDFAELTGLDPTDERFDSHDKRCGSGRIDLIRLLTGAFAEQPAEHWYRVFEERQLAAEVIEDFRYPLHDREARINGYIIDLDDPNFGSVATLGFPVHLSETPPALDRLAPGRGQHTRQVLREMLGLTSDQLHLLADAGIIGA